MPDDKRIGQDVYVLKRNFGEAKNNQKVVVEITEWAPDSRRNIEGKIVEVLGLAIQAMSAWNFCR